MQPVSEEEHFLNLFQSAFGRIKDNVNQKISGDEVREGISEVIDSFRGSPSKAFKSHRFTKDEDFLVYFYRYSPLSASIARNRILAALEGCPDFRTRFDKESLKIVNVGGGANTDLVGLYSALHGKDSFEEMDITVMEKYGGWAPYPQVVDERLKLGDFGNASDLRKNKKITCTFIVADMKDISEECAEAFGKADIVWMKGFVSALQEGMASVMDNIKSYMKIGALLVVMDSPTYFQHIHLNDSSIPFKNIFQPIFFTDLKEYKYVWPHLSDIATKSNQEIGIYRKIR